jgi:hypothetical protein
MIEVGPDLLVTKYVADLCDELLGLTSSTHQLFHARVWVLAMPFLTRRT